jgi:hypothetical protein
LSALIFDQIGHRARLLQFERLLHRTLLLAYLLAVGWGVLTLAAPRTKVIQTVKTFASGSFAAATTSWTSPPAFPVRERRLFSLGTAGVVLLLTAILASPLLQILRILSIGKRLVLCLGLYQVNSHFTFNYLDRQITRVQYRQLLHPEHLLKEFDCSYPILNRHKHLKLFLLSKKLHANLVFLRINKHLKRVAHRSYCHLFQG